MPIHLRQVCLVAETLAPLEQNIRTLLGTPVCHRDPEVATFGLENALFAFGSQFLEVVAPVTDGTAAGRFLQRRGGVGGYMVICQADSLETQAGVRERAAANGVRVAFEADRGTWNIMQLHPADMGAAFLEVDWDQQADPQGNWQAAGGLTWKNAAGLGDVTGITGATLASAEPEQLAQRWADVLGQPVQREGGVPVVQLANGTLRFVRGDCPLTRGLIALDISVSQLDDLIRSAGALGLPTSSDGFQLGGVWFHCQATAVR